MATRLGQFWITFVSPNARLAVARYWSMSTLWRTNRIDPSPMAKLHPPVWLLPKLMSLKLVDPL